MAMRRTGSTRSMASLSSVGDGDGAMDSARSYGDLLGLDSRSAGQTPRRRHGYGHGHSSSGHGYGYGYGYGSSGRYGGVDQTSLDGE